MEPITPTQFAGEAGLEEWRVLLRAAEATFVATTMTEATRFVSAVTHRCESIGHLPDLDLRPDGRVFVRLVSYDQRGLSDRDVEVARVISAIAATHELRSDTTRLMRLEIAIDAIDIDAVLPFWRAVLGYVDEPTSAGSQVNALIDPSRIGPAVWFQQMDSPRRQRNRIHLDVTVPHDEADARIAVSLAAGGTMVSDAAARAFWVLADVEGNEACITTWQDRD
jgi:4a-hydroxytetrahydrobiopterin dehydratase